MCWLLLALLTLVGRIYTSDLISAANTLIGASKSDLRSRSVEDLFYTLSVADVLDKPVSLDGQEVCKKLKEDFERLASPSLSDCFFVVGSHRLLSNYCDLSWLEEHLRNLDAPDSSSPRELFRYFYATEDFRGVRKVSANKAKSFLEKLTSHRLSDSDLGHCLLLGAIIMPELKSEKEFFESLLKSSVTRLRLLSGRLHPVESSRDVSLLMVGVLELNEVISATAATFLDRESVAAMINFVEQPKKLTTELTWNLVDIADRLCPPQVLEIYDRVPLILMPIDRGHVSSVYIDTRNPIMYISISDVLGKPVDAILELVSLTRVDRGRDSMSIDKRFEPRDSSKMIHSLSLADSKVPIGTYVASIKVKLNGDRASTQNELVPFDVKTSIEVASVSVKISSGSGNSQAVTLKQGDHLPAGTTLSRDQDVKIEVELKGNESGENLPKPESAFVCLEPDEEEQSAVEVLKHFETCFTPSQKSGLQYQFHIAGPALGARLMNIVGGYKIRFVAHHRLLLHSAEFDMGQVNLDYKKRQDSAFASILRPKKAPISHTFARPEPRPPFVVSAMFSGIIAALLFLLLILWKSAGANLSRCPLSIFVPLYHLVHAASIVALCYCWAFRNMFFTIKAVVLLYVILFLLGRRVVISTLKKQ